MCVFDQVKVVRETMNQMIEAWKGIPDLCGAVSPPESGSSLKGSDIRHFSFMVDGTVSH